MNVRLLNKAFDIQHDRHAHTASRSHTSHQSDSVMPYNRASLLMRSQRHSKSPQILTGRDATASKQFAQLRCIVARSPYAELPQDWFRRTRKSRSVSARSPCCITSLYLVTRELHMLKAAAMLPAVSRTGLVIRVNNAQKQCSGRSVKPQECHLPTLLR